MNKKKKILVWGGSTILALGAVAVPLFLNESPAFSFTAGEVSKEFNLDLSQDIVDGKIYAREEGHHSIPFSLTVGSTKEDALTLVNGKRRFRQGDTLANIAQDGKGIAGITEIEVYGGSGYYTLYIGYEADKLFEYNNSTSDGGDRTFSDLPKINFFKLVGKYDNYTCDIESLKIKYTADNDTCVYGEETPVEAAPLYAGTFVKSSNTITLSSDKKTLSVDGVDLTYTGLVLPNGVLFHSAEDSVYALAKFSDEDNLSFIYNNSPYHSLSGNYGRATEATGIVMKADGEVVSSNTSENRATVCVGDEFAFSAATNGVPSSVATVSFVDESHQDATEGTSEPFVGKFTVEDIQMEDSFRTFDLFVISILELEIEKEGDLYLVSYKDKSDLEAYGNHEFLDTVKLLDNQLIFNIDEYDTSVTVTLGNNATYYVDIEFWGGEEEYGSAYATNDDSVVVFTPTSGSAGTPEYNSSSFSGGTFKALAPGFAHLTCTYGELTATYYVEVVEETFTLNVDASKAKTEYETGDTLSTTGLVVTLISDQKGTSKTVYSYTPSKPDMSTVGEKTVTVTATVNGVEYTATYTINVKAKSAPQAEKYKFDDDAGETHTLEVGDDYAAIDDDYLFEEIAAEKGNTRSFKYVGDEDVTIGIYGDYLYFYDSDEVLFGYESQVLVYFSEYFEITAA